jgi:hypothetical protein
MTTKEQLNKFFGLGLCLGTGCKEMPGWPKNQQLLAILLAG